MSRVRETLQQEAGHQLPQQGDNSTGATKKSSKGNPKKPKKY